MADEQNDTVVEAHSVEFERAEDNVQSVAQPQFYREKSSSDAAQKPSKLQLLKDFFVECQRVLRITKKPNKEELKTIVKVSGLGMLVIGLVGFFIHLLKELLF
ncbi:protein translocase SEC61 complex subunit gamma [Candidatus Woesearchaeota archaeon]|nr:protein translocase SEC61 complex subunit gamma [Candidatus Woesearchaeota archaeon]